MDELRISFRNCILAIWNQLTRKGAWRNVFVTHNAFGIFSKYSHISRRSGKPKIPYPNKNVALRAAEAMGISLYTDVHGATDGISGRMPRIR